MRRFLTLFFPVLLTGCSAGPGLSGTQGTTLVQTTYSQVQAQILNTYCLSCHNDQTPKAGVNFQNYESTITSPGTIVPYQPYQSELYKMVYNGKMPPKGPALSPLQLQSIYDWIALGAPNN